MLTMEWNRQGHVFYISNYMIWVCLSTHFKFLASCRFEDGDEHPDSFRRT
jgi:hypothetical protein